MANYWRQGTDIVVLQLIVLAHFHIPKKSKCDCKAAIR